MIVVSDNNQQGQAGQSSRKGMRLPKLDQTTYHCLAASEAADSDQDGS